MNAKHEETNGTSINYRLSKISVMLGNTGKSKCSSFLDRWIELFEAIDKSIEGTGVNDSLGKMRRVLSNRSENIGGSFLVESLKNIVQINFKSF